MFSKLLLLILLFGFCKEKNIELPKEINVQKEDIKKEEEIYFWTSSKSGIHLREKPDIKSKSIYLLPFRTKLKHIETDSREDIVNSIKDHCVLIESKFGRGWVFSGYIVKESPGNFHSYAPNQKWKAICEGISNSFECYNKIEPIQLKKIEFSKLVQRNVNELILSLENGEKLILKDGNTEVSRFYRFLEHIPEINYYSLVIQYYEGSRIMLINSKSGKDYEFWNYPVISDDYTKLIDADYCPDGTPAYYCGNGLKIYFVNHQNNNELEEEFSIKEGILSPVWMNNNSVNILYFNDFSDERNFLPDSAKINFVDKKWILSK